MIWSRLRKMAISLPAALLAVVLLVGINETGYMRSHDAVGDWPARTPRAPRWTGCCRTC